MPKKELKEFAAKAHKLKPIVIIGSKGLTPAVQTEIDQALEHHELIKIKIAGGDADYRSQIISEVCSAQKADLVTKIGRVFTIYRKKKE